MREHERVRHHQCTSFENLILNAFEHSRSKDQEKSNSTENDVKGFDLEKVDIIDVVGKGKGKGLNNVGRNQVINVLGEGKESKTDLPTFKVVDVIDEGVVRGEGVTLDLGKVIHDEDGVEKDGARREVMNIFGEEKNLKEFRMSDTEFCLQKENMKMSKSVGPSSGQLSNVLELIDVDSKFDNMAERGKKKMTRKKRLMNAVYNCVYEDLEDEWLMETTKVDSSLDDVMNDISNKELMYIQNVVSYDYII